MEIFCRRPHGARRAERLGSRPLPRVLAGRDRAARALARRTARPSSAPTRPLVRFVEESGARSAQGFTGLFHVALLVPDRPSLGRFLAHTVRDAIPLTGLSDHRVSEAIYLRDPDYHGIEVYADRPRAQWEGRVAQTMTTIPLDGRARCWPRRAIPSSTGCPTGRRWATSTSACATSSETIGFYRDRARHGADRAPRRPGRLPQRRRLPPSPRRQHVGDARRKSRHRKAPRGSSASRSSSRTTPRSSASPGRSAGPRSAIRPGTRSRSPPPESRLQPVEQKLEPVLPDVVPRVAARREGRQLADVLPGVDPPRLARG